MLENNDYAPQRAEMIEKQLRRRGIEPMLVLCSYAAANDELLERLRVLPEQSASVLVIGHNPGLQELALVLATPGRTRRRLEAEFPTAALATLAVSHATWAQLAAGDAELTAFVVPKQLR